jgi:hypothetical protein
MKKLTIALSAILLAVSLLITITITMSETARANDIELEELPGTEDF